MKTSYNSADEFSSLLQDAFGSEEFARVPVSQKGLAVNNYIKEYVDAKGITDQKEIDALKDVGAISLSQEKVRLGMSPYVPSEGESQDLYEPYTARKGDVGDAIREIEAWREKSFRKAMTLRPADRGDLSQHLRHLELLHIREAVGRETGYVKDKAMRVIEGVASQPLYLLGTNVRERVLAEYIPESPKYDHEPESQTASIAGAVIFYVILFTLVIKVVKGHIGRKAQPDAAGVAHSGDG